MRRFIILCVVAMAGAVLVGEHCYIAVRLILDPGVPEPWRSALLGALLLLGSSLVVAPFVERMLPPPLSRAISWPAALWMGAAFLLTMLLVATDVLLWAFEAATDVAPGALAASESASALRAAIVVAVAAISGAFGLHSALRSPRLHRVEIGFERWPAGLDGFRIVQISDLHIGPILGREFAARLVSRVNALDPDLVAVTGDLVDGGVRQLADEVAPLAGLRGRHGVFFVTGNHDYYSGVHSWVAKARELGMHPLRNRRVEIREGSTCFDLVGVDDHHGSLFGASEGEDLAAALADRDPARPAILLAHDPTTFKRASSLGIDLQISGHTHGGQIWPFAYLVRLVIPFVAGHYRRNGAQLFVSRGTGFWGPPMRLLAPAEITELVLRRAPQR